MNGRSVKVGRDWMVGGRENEGRKSRGKFEGDGR